MRKFTMMTSVVLLAGMLTGCAGTPVVYYSECNCPQASTGSVNENGMISVETTAASETTAAAQTAPAEGALKTGLAIEANTTGSENGKVVDYDVTLVAVTVDDNGVIQSCILDGIAAKVEIDGSGSLVSDVNGEILTKNELGDNYGMKAYGGAKYEWYEQANALAEYAVGKTVDELKNGAIDESGKAPAGSDLASTATIYLGGYVSAIEAAVNNAEHLGAQAGDELRLAANLSAASSKAATVEEAGLAQLDADVTAVTVNDGVITSCHIDSLQAKVSFDNKGAITSDLTNHVATKNELGENYGMKAYAGSAYEWNEQAAALAQYVTGKTLDEVTGIAVNEKTAPTDADLSSTVTIAIGGYQALIAKAMQ